MCFPLAQVFVFGGANKRNIRTELVGLLFRCPKIDLPKCLHDCFVSIFMEIDTHSFRMLDKMNKKLIVFASLIYRQIRSAQTNTHYLLLRAKYQSISNRLHRWIGVQMTDIFSITSTLKTAVLDTN